MDLNDVLAEVVVSLLLEKDGKVLLQKRANTGYQDGNYGFVGGHVAKGETLREALTRETMEETGIRLNEKNLKCICVTHKIGEKRNFVSFVFKTNEFEGTPQIMEKDKCTDLNWFDKNNLPENIIGTTREVIQKYDNSEIKIEEIKV